jgi:alkylation response protein AidB-like acyl-CoA dehydrogenase
MQELARVDAGVAAVCELHNAVASGLVSSYGSPELKASLLTRLASDTLGAVVAHDEDVPGSSLTVKPDADGFVLQGVKAWCTHARCGCVLLQ